MAIKQRKQLTGTTEQINAYSGVEGQLVWDKTKKKWVGMSGTAGTNYPMASESHTHSIANISDLQTALNGKATTKALTDGLAGKADKTHTHAVADVTGLQSALDGKQAKGDYATTTALNDGLAGKANSAHTHVVNDVTGLTEALNGKISITGDRGFLAGYSTASEGTTVDNSSKDTQFASRSVTVANGTGTSTWTKVVTMSGGSVSLGSKWVWSGGKAPALKFPGALVCHWNGGISKGIASFISGAS